MHKVSLLIAAAIAACAATAFAGNDAPSGAHYNLNLIGVKNAKDVDMTGNNGHRIFVPLNGSTKILLAPGDDFDVLDANGTDGSAKFQLPVPGENWCTQDVDTGDITCPASATVDYQIFIRALGIPGGTAQMYTCISDPDLPGGYICSTPEYQVSLTRDNSGPSKFTNVTKQLLFVSADVDADGKVEHVQIFDPLFDGYYWQYDNNGLKLAQMRFYEIETTIVW